jgi:2-polyprenyl-6-methoxyphenol hydroxylase-like FAD-dependent oxidoreductase
MALALDTAGEPGGFFRFTNSRLRDAYTMRFTAGSDGGRQMDRQVLRSVLMIGLDERIHYGKRAVAVEPISADEMALQFADGTRTQASVIVGADGVGSALRSQILPGHEPAALGNSGIYGRTALIQNGRSVLPEVLRGSGVLAIGNTPGRAVFFTAMRFSQALLEAFERPASGQDVAGRGDYVMWGITLSDDERPPAGIESDPAALLSHARHLAEGFHPLVHQLISTADADASVVTSFSVGARPRGPRAWALPRATLMGDAVHVMPPFGAHGGNTALRDAALLGEKLLAAARGEMSVELALALYQDEMVPYAFASVDRAATMMRRLGATGPVLRWIALEALPRLHRVTVADTP